MTTQNISEAVPGDLLDVLTAHFEIPNINERTLLSCDRLDVMWGLRELVVRLRPIIDWYESQEQNLIVKLRNHPELAERTEGSSTYRAVVVPYQFKVVNVPKVLAELPDTYDELAYVDANTFKVHFGERRMRSILRAYLNEEGNETAPLPLERIRKEELVNEMGETGAAPYLQEQERVGYVEISKDGAAYPYKFWKWDTKVIYE